jgi:hypothetical protein
MMAMTLIALALFGSVWVVHYLLQTLIALSIDVEEADLNAARSPKNFEHLKTISVLRSLEIIMGTVFMAVLPIGGIIIGAILPDPVRSALSETVGAKTVVVVAIVALFAYSAVFRTLRQHQGKKVRAAIVKLFRSTTAEQLVARKTAATESGPPPPTKRKKNVGVSTSGVRPDSAPVIAQPGA